MAPLEASTITPGGPEGCEAASCTAASQHKLHCIETAGKVAAERATLLTGSADITGNDRLSLRWEKLVKLAKSCKEKNDVNGMLIRWQHRYIEQTLAVLRADNSDAKLYGPDGSNERSNKQRRGSIGLA